MASSTPAPETTTYKANCHCGQIKFTVAMPDITKGKVLRCNCSICIKNGYLLVYPKCEDVKFVTGQDSLGGYRFGRAQKPHRFCPRCGTSILIDFSESDREIERTVTAVNVRTFMNIGNIMKDLEIRDFDGMHKLQPPYEEPW